MPLCLNPAGGGRAHFGRGAGQLRGGDVGDGQTPGLARLGASPAHVLAMFAQHAGEAGLDGEVNAFIGERRHGAHRWHGGIALLLRDPLTAGMRRSENGTTG